MSFTNLYYKRTAGTAKSCYICYKPTTTVLATINTSDFLYTCPTHLADRGFATPAGGTVDGARKPKSPPDEIAKVKEEWEEKQKKKAEQKSQGKGEENEKSKEQDKAKEHDKGKDKAQDKGKDKEQAPETQDKEAESKPDTSHEQYTLHRDYFAMRLAEHRKRKQAAQAKDLAPRLPSAPRSMPI